MVWEIWQRSFPSNTHGGLESGLASQNPFTHPSRQERSHLRTWILYRYWKYTNASKKNKWFVFKGAGASEAGGQTKEGALSKRYFQTSEIAQNRTKSPVPIVIDVFGVTAPYGNPYGSKIAIVWLFFVIFWPFWSHFQLLWSRLCIKLAPSAPKPSSHIGPLMRQPFLPDPGAYPGIQGPKNGYFLAKSGPNG